MPRSGFAEERHDRHNSGGLAGFSSIFGGCLAGDLFEHPIEGGQRLESAIVGDFADAKIWIEQEPFGLLDSRPREELDETQARVFAELLAEVEKACVHRA